MADTGLITTLTSTVNEIKNDITSLKASKSTTESFEQDLKNGITARQQLATRLEDSELKIKLPAIVIRQDNQILELTSQSNTVAKTIEERKHSYYRSFGTQ